VAVASGRLEVKTSVQEKAADHLPGQLSRCLSL